MGLRNCCWNAAAIAYSSTAALSRSRFAWSGPPTSENCCWAANWNPRRSTSFANATGRVRTVRAAVLSASSCTDVPNGLTVGSTGALVSVGETVSDVVAAVAVAIEALAGLSVWPISRLTQPSSAHSVGGSAGVAGPPVACGCNPTAVSRPETRPDTSPILGGAGAAAGATVSAAASRAGLSWASATTSLSWSATVAAVNVAASARGVVELGSTTAAAIGSRSAGVATATGDLLVDRFLGTVLFTPTGASPSSVAVTSVDVSSPAPDEPRLLPLEEDKEERSLPLEEEAEEKDDADTVEVGPSPDREPFVPVEPVEPPEDAGLDEEESDDADEPESFPSAHAMPGLLAIAAPSPNATASAPTRPMNLAQPAHVGTSCIGRRYWS